MSDPVPIARNGGSGRGAGGGEAEEEEEFMFSMDGSGGSLSPHGLLGPSNALRLAVAVADGTSKLKMALDHQPTAVVGESLASRNTRDLQLFERHYDERMMEVRDKECLILDMDGTLWVTTVSGGNKAIPGAAQFLRWAIETGKKVMLLTNGSTSTPAKLATRLHRLLDLDIPEESFITSAQSTAYFLKDQHPGARCFVLGEEALVSALTAEGLEVVTSSPDYVVMGESRKYEYENLTLAINFVNQGVRFIATNNDVVDIDEHGNLDPSTGSFAAIITAATGVAPYYLGKPNSLMIHHALERLGCHRHSACIVGDRMDTDIICGTEARIRTVLTLTGVTHREALSRFAYMPYLVVDSVADIVPPGERGGD